MVEVAPNEGSRRSPSGGSLVGTFVEATTAAGDSGGYLAVRG
jgi:hypothetical protein